jgi:hypothetical protein
MQVDTSQQYNISETIYQVESYHHRNIATSKKPKKAKVVDHFKIYDDVCKVVAALASMD